MGLARRNAVPSPLLAWPFLWFHLTLWSVELWAVQTLCPLNRLIVTKEETESLRSGVTWLEHTGDSQPFMGRTQLLCSEGWRLKGAPACLLPFSACRRGSVCLRKCHSRRILVPWGGVFDSIPHHPQLSSWQPDWNQIGFNAFHNFVEQICGLREQIKYTFLFGIIKNVTCRLEMDIPSLGIDTVNPKPFLPRIFFLGWFSLRFMGSLIPKSYLRTGMWSSGQDWASASLLEIWILSLLPCIQFYFPHPFPWALSWFTRSPCSWTNRYGMLESTPVPYPFSELWVEPINIYIVHR